MKTLIELLNQHQITNPSDRLEFEEVLNAVTRQHGADLQQNAIDCETAVSTAQQEADTLVAAERAEKELAVAALASLQEKTSKAIADASKAIADPELDDKTTVKAVAVVLEEVTKDDRQRAREALEASIKSQQEQLAAII